MIFIEDMIIYGLREDNMEHAIENERALSSLWDWEAKYFVDFLESIDDTSAYITDNKFAVDKMVNDFYQWQERYALRDDVDNKRWVIIDRDTHVIVAFASYDGHDKHVVRDYRLKKWVDDLNSRKVELK